MQESLNISALHICPALNRTLKSYLCIATNIYINLMDVMAKMFYFNANEKFKAFCLTMETFFTKLQH